MLLSRLNLGCSRLAATRRPRAAPLPAPRLRLPIAARSAAALTEPPALGDWPSTDEEGDQQEEEDATVPQPFALSTMEEDGQAWMFEELGHKLVGLQYATPRAKVVTTQLLGYEGGLIGTSKGTSRCDELMLDLGWEGTAKEAQGTKLQGVARVTMSREDHTDRVMVDVQLRPPEGGEAAPSERVLRDIEYAVRSLDSAIMDRLNTFLWQCEAINSTGGAAECMA